MTRRVAENAVGISDNLRLDRSRLFDIVGGEIRYALCLESVGRVVFRNYRKEILQIRKLVIRNVFRVVFINPDIALEKLRIEGDGPSLVSGVFGHADGAGMICGTGSSLYVRKGDDYYHIGGGGHMIDSCGSGYVLARRAIRAALRAVDGSEVQTMLVEMLEEAAGFPLWYRLDQIYTRGRSYVASFAHVLFEARNKGDIVARRIFNECASDLADVIWAQYKKNGGAYDLIFNGGIFRNYPEYADTVKAMAPKDMRIFFADVSPVYGGAVEALYDIGIRADEDFKEKFMKSYEAIKKA